MRPPALSRPFDRSYSSNIFVLAATPVIGAVVGLGTLLAGESLGDAFRWGFHAGGAAFLAWAMAIELHPDRPWLAAVATALGPVGLLWGVADLFANAVVLLVIRAVAGTTGRSMRTSDLILLGVVAAPVVLRPTGPGTMTIGALGLVATVVWHERGRPFHAVAATAYIAGSVVSWALVDDVGWLDGDGAILFVVGAAAGLIGLLGPRRVETPTDRRGGVILSGRVRWGRFFALAAAALVSATHEPAAMAPVWAALIALALDSRGERR